MNPHAYTESQLVEQPAIGLFAALGWQTVSAMGEILGSYAIWMAPVLGTSPQSWSRLFGWHLSGCRFRRSVWRLQRPVRPRRCLLPVLDGSPDRRPGGDLDRRHLRQLHVPPAAPASITATASGTSVVVTWSACACADAYHLERKVTGQPWSEVAVTAASPNPPTTLTDTAPPIIDDGIAVYRVRASKGTLFSPYSPLDFAHPGQFTNDPINTTVTTVKAVHLIEIRKGINAIADAAGLAPPYAAGELLQSSLTGRVILATDMTDAMSWLNAVRTSSPYGRSVAGFGVTPVVNGIIYGSQIVDLRNGLQ
jgi:hypothetical protein